MREIEIKSATVIRADYSPDVCYLYTTLPDPEWPFKDHLVLKFNAARDTGPEYILNNFGIKSKLVE